MIRQFFGHTILVWQAVHFVDNFYYLAIRPLCIFQFLVIHFVDLYFISLVIRPLCGLVFHHLSDPSTLWTAFCIRPSCGLKMIIFVGLSVHLVDLILYPSILWTSSDHPCRRICPLYGLHFASVHFVDFN